MVLVALWCLSTFHHAQKSRQAFWQFRCSRNWNYNQVQAVVPGQPWDKHSHWDREGSVLELLPPGSGCCAQTLVPVRHQLWAAASQHPSNLFGTKPGSSVTGRQMALRMTTLLLCASFWRSKTHCDMLLISTDRGTRELASPWDTLIKEKRVLSFSWWSIWGVWQSVCCGCCTINGHHSMLQGLCQKASDCGVLPQEQPCKFCRIHTASQDAVESAWFLSFQNQNNYCFSTAQTLTVLLLPARLLKNM